MNKFFTYFGLLIFIIISAVIGLWDAIPPAACNDKNATLYTPKQMVYNSFYYEGLLADNQAEAACWKLQSAQAGNKDILSSVGINFEKGLGVDKNIATAIIWYKRSIKAGRSGGAYRMALLYRDGNGVKASKKISEQYFRKQQKLKKTEPKYEFDSSTAHTFKSIYQATLNLDRHFYRLLGINSN